MTRKEYRRRIRDLARNSREHLIDYAEKALASGALDLKSATDDWLLPKNVIVAAALDLAGPRGYGPSEHNPSAADRRAKKEIRNIRATA